MRIPCQFENRTSFAWPKSGFSIGWQLFDPDTQIFIAEGEWLPLPADVAPTETAAILTDIELPPEDGRYSIYVSPRSAEHGWLYMQDHPFILLDAEMKDGEACLHSTRTTTLSQLRRQRLWPSLKTAVRAPFADLWANRNLIQSLTGREVLARYRGSMGDVAWTVLHPLLLMATYFFVFGVVLQSRFGNDPSRTAFALYFLAGMLPWLAFNEPLARAPHIILEHRNFVKKLVFPVSILPVNPVFAALITSLFATALYLVAAYIAKGTLYATTLLLPAIIVPQLLFTLGMCWFLAALGVYLRDLTQVMTFLLTIWFFVTPICYPESSLPAALIPYLAQNPMFQIVRFYRMILLEGVVPPAAAMAKLWVLAMVVFLAGHAFFRKLRRSFPDLL